MDVLNRAGKISVGAILVYVWAWPKQGENSGKFTENHHRILKTCFGKDGTFPACITERKTNRSTLLFPSFLRHLVAPGCTSSGAPVNLLTLLRLCVRSWPELSREGKNMMRHIFSTNRGSQKYSFQHTFRGGDSTDTSDHMIRKL